MSDLQLGPGSREERRERSASAPPRAAAASPAAPQATRTAPALRAVDSAELLGREGIVVIEHAGERYTLRRTRHGRLILTK